MEYLDKDQSLTRRLSVFDLEEFARHLLRLDSESRRMRFGSHVSDDFLLQYARASKRWDVIIYGYFVRGNLRAVAELRPITVAGGREAELAFSIEKPWHGRGIGTNLFCKVLRAARNRGYRRLHLSCLSSNDAMQALARKFNARFIHDRGGATGVLEPQLASPSSLISEAADEAAAFVFGTIHLPKWSLSDLPALFRRSA